MGSTRTDGFYGSVVSRERTRERIENDEAEKYRAACGRTGNYKTGQKESTREILGRSTRASLAEAND